ncbi:MAG: hypothetical protein COA94_05980 [Rickettsiales bacterium]|nr:MAG: hypothetical protein COA94_05980 [Rickettsiales bacterium]
MPHDNLKTKWPPGTSPELQLQQLFSALVTRIGLTNIKGVAVFVRYVGDDNDGGVSTQNAVFTAGAEVDSVYDWMKEVTRDATQE